MAPIQRVLISVAMVGEAQPLIDAMQLKPVERGVHADSPALMFRGEHCADHGVIAVFLVCAGRDEAHKDFKGDGICLVGTDAAALTLFLAATSLSPRPDLVVNAGTCGGFAARGGAIGSVIVPSAFAHHDRRVALPGYAEAAVGRRESAPAAALRGALGFGCGLCRCAACCGTTCTCDTVLWLLLLVLLLIVLLYVQHRQLVGSLALRDGGVHSNGGRLQRHGGGVLGLGGLAALAAAVGGQGCHRHC